MEADENLCYSRFRIDRKNKAVYENEREIRLEPIPFNVFQFLVEHVGERFSTDDLLDRFWPETHVGPSNVTTAIYKIRCMLGDDRAFLEGKSKVGYRLKKLEGELPEERVRLGLDSQGIDPPALPGNVSKSGRILAPVLRSADSDGDAIHGKELGRPFPHPDLESVNPKLFLAPHLNETHKSIDTALIYTPKFVLSLDGIIVNSVGELIYERVSEETIAECNSSYQRALEDFSFALVYGSQIRARWPWQVDDESGKESQAEPAQLLISALPTAVYEREVFDDDLKTTPFLADEENLNQIRAYIRSMGQCLNDAFFVRLSRDWIAREAATYFGIHDTLFQRAKDPSDYRFGKDYYSHLLLEEVPALMGTPSFTALVDFVPEYPHKRWTGMVNDRYEDEARVRFIKEIVLTHLATMHQFEKNAERYRMWRMPYALRAEVTKLASKTGMQRQLRNVVVRHALLYALRNVSRIDRKELIIGVLASIRGVHPFNMIREMLEELSLIQLDPDISRENRARTLLQEIRNAADPLRDQPRDSYSLARASVLKELEGVDLDEYRGRLFEFFPQLAVRGYKPQSLPHAAIHYPKTRCPLRIAA